MLPAGQPHSFEHREAAWATPLCYAIVGGNLKIVERLISQGATIEPHSGRFLDYAMAYNRVEIVKALLENGADPSKAPRILDDNSEMSKLLKNHGASPKDIDDQGDMGWPMLVYVCRGDNREHPDKVLRLLELGADIDVRNLQRKNGVALRREGRGFSRLSGYSSKKVLRLMPLITVAKPRSLRRSDQQ